MKPKTEDRTVRRILFVALAAMLLMPAVTAAEEMPAGEPDIRAFGVSDEALPANLYFMRSPGLDPVPEGVTVYGVRDGVYLVSGDVRVLRALSMRGYEVTPVHGLPEAPQSEPREWTRIEEPDPAISALVDQVDWDGVGDKIGHLVNFKTRSCIAPNHENVASSITRVFESYGLPTEMQPFDYFSLTMWNIVAVQRGTKYPDSYMFQQLVFPEVLVTCAMKDICNQPPVPPPCSGRIIEMALIVKTVRENVFDIDCGMISFD